MPCSMPFRSTTCCRDCHGALRSPAGWVSRITRWASAAPYSVAGRRSVEVWCRAPVPDAGQLRERLWALAAECFRFEYRRPYALLRREGRAVDHKRAQRPPLGKLIVRRRRSRRRALSTRSPFVTPRSSARRHPNFMHDQRTQDRRFPTLTVVDTCTRIPGLGDGHAPVRHSAWRATPTRSWRESSILCGER